MFRGQDFALLWSWAFLSNLGGGVVDWIVPAHESRPLPSFSNLGGLGHEASPLHRPSRADLALRPLTLKLAAMMVVAIVIMTAVS